LTSNNSVKPDALDLVMTVLKEHEKRLDRIVEQLTVLTKSMEKANLRFNEKIEAIQHDTLSS
jgi:hypothetical protein